MSDKITSNWKGSEITSNMVRKQIQERYGAEEATKYDPASNCLTFKQWLNNGFKVKKGEKALQSYVVIEKKNKAGEVVDKYPKKISLFYQTQVEAVQ